MQLESLTWKQAYNTGATCSIHIQIHRHFRWFSIYKVCTVWHGHIELRHSKPILKLRLAVCLSKTSTDLEPRCWDWLEQLAWKCLYHDPFRIERHTVQGSAISGYPKYCFTSYSSSYREQIKKTMRIKYKTNFMTREQVMVLVNLPNLHIGKSFSPCFRNSSASAFVNPSGASWISFG